MKSMWNSRNTCHVFEQKNSHILKSWVLFPFFWHFYLNIAIFFESLPSPKKKKKLCFIEIFHCWMRHRKLMQWNIRKNFIWCGDSKCLEFQATDKPSRDITQIRNISCLQLRYKEYFQQTDWIWCEKLFLFRLRLW